MHRNDRNWNVLREELEDLSSSKVHSGVTQFSDLAGEVITALLCVRRDQIAFGEEYKDLFPVGVLERPRAWGFFREDAGDKVALEISSGEQFVLFHPQSCCERVVLEDVEGDFQDLIGNPLLRADESCNESREAIRSPLATWTFYKFATIKGSVHLRWDGQSNGYYSQRVDFAKLDRAWRPT